MAFTDKNFETLLKEIGFERFVMDDLISPEKNPELFVKSSLNDKLLCPSGEYKERILKKMQLEKDIVPIAKGLIGECVLNIYEHAHQLDESLPLSIKIAEGTNGYVIRLRDSGPGFDYQEVIGKIKNDKTGEYCHRYGVGMASLYAYDVEAGFEEGGRVLNIKFGRKS